jgi:hypothetical protein
LQFICGRELEVAYEITPRFVDLDGWSGAANSAQMLIRESEFSQRAPQDASFFRPLQGEFEGIADHGDALSRKSLKL